MSFASRKMSNVQPVSTTGFTGAAPQTVAGNTIVMGKPGASPRPGTLSAKVVAKATTSTLTITAKWQVSDDGSTWIDAYGPNRATNVAIVTGTGSAVTDTVNIAAPDGVYSFNYARCIAVSGVGVGAGAPDDQAAISYFFLKDRV
jgi:hypothetical protein